MTAPRSYHPYRHGYSVLPALRPLGDEPIFEVDDQLADYIAAKQAVEHQPYLEHELRPQVMTTIVGFLNERLSIEHPSFQATDDFSQLALQVQEDLIIHQIEGERDWMAACHVSLPSHWRPADKIGRTFAEIHAPVPGMKSNPQLVRSMLKGPFVRFVWGVDYSPRLNGHPDQPRVPFAGRVWARVERQVVVGFPELNAVLFTIRPYVFEPELPALREAVLAMTPEQRAYKNMSDEFMAWLEASC